MSANRILVFLVISALLAVCGCGKKGKGEFLPGDKYTVFVTIPPLASIADSIAGGAAKIETLLPPGAEPHTYEPTPGDIRRLANSAILFEIGLGLDEWATPIALDADDGPRIVPVSVGVPTLPALPERLRQRYLKDDKIAAHGNPHVWLDPNIVADMIIPSMSSAFAEADPQNANYYRANANRLKKRIKALSEETAIRLAALKGKPVILDHGSFIYFCRRFGIPVLDVLEPFPGQQPTPGDLAEIIEMAAEKKPFAILVEPQVSPKPAQIISEETGVRIIHIDPLGKVGEGYIELMKRNIEAIESGFDAE